MLAQQFAEHGRADSARRLAFSLGVLIEAHMPLATPSTAKAPTCHMKVSELMQWLRGEQSALNYFLWSTELSYGFVLSSDDKRLSDTQALAAGSLSNVQSQAWYPNTAGNQKYNAKIDSFLQQLPKNQAIVAQATAMMWYGKFEIYLTSRLEPYSKRNHWGPFTQTLNLPALTNAGAPLRAKTVLRADLCRHLRNLMTHEAHLPDDLDDPSVRQWIEARRKEGSKNQFCASLSEIKQAAAEVVGQAISSLKADSAKDKELSLTFFYALFTFTNFDSLALEIEEALVQAAAPVVATVRRQRDKVRRKDLIVSS